MCHIQQIKPANRYNVFVNRKDNKDLIQCLTPGCGGILIKKNLYFKFSALGLVMLQIRKALVKLRLSENQSLLFCDFFQLIRIYLWA